MGTEEFSQKVSSSKSSKQLSIEEGERKIIYNQALEARTILYKAKNKAIAQLEVLRRRKFFLHTLASVFIVFAFLSFAYELSSPERALIERIQRLTSNGWFLGCIGVIGVINTFAWSDLDRAQELKKRIKEAENTLNELDHELFGLNKFWY